MYIHTIYVYHIYTMYNYISYIHLVFIDILTLYDYLRLSNLDVENQGGCLENDLLRRLETNGRGPT